MRDKSPSPQESPPGATPQGKARVDPTHPLQPLLEAVSTISVSLSQISGVDESNHLRLPCSFAARGDFVTQKTIAMCDSGATSSFVSHAFVKKHGLPLKKLPTNRRIVLADPKAL